MKRFQGAYEKVYGYFEDLDTCQTGLEKRLVQLEVGLSKAQMLINAAQKTSAGLASSQNFNQMKAKREKRALLRERAVQMKGRSRESEEIIIQSLQAMYKSQKENLQNQALIAKNLEFPEYQPLLDKGLAASAATKGETTM